MASRGPVLESASTDSGFAAVSTLLRRKGVRVKLRKGSPHQHGTLTLNGNDLVLTMKKCTKAEPTRSTTTSLSSIRDVQLVDAGQEGIFCRTSLRKEGAGLSFACCDGIGDLSSPETTKLMALVIKDVLNQRQGKAPIAPQEHPGVAFRRLLEPIGLLHEYYEAFREAGIDAEDLSVVTRGDLIELVGVTDRRHQIKIVAQIKRLYPDNPPCCCSSRHDQNAAKGELASRAGSIVGGVVASLIL